MCRWTTFLAPLSTVPPANEIAGSRFRALPLTKRGFRSILHLRSPSSNTRCEKVEAANELFAQRDEVALYVEHAQQMLQVADHNLADGFYTSAINRAYYAIFYAANALLATKGLSRSKHAAVIAAFRQHFVKPGLLESEYSDIYGRLMDDRRKADYEIIESTVDPARARTDLGDARRFVERVERYLKQKGWL